MASLDIDIRLVHGSGTGTVFHTATQVVQSSHFIPKYFRGNRILYKGNSVVHRGVVVFTGSQEAEPAMDAVCKVALGDLSRIRREAQLYVSPDHLLKLQGSVVPQFYGYYECKVQVEEREVDMGCMFLEYCGQRVSSKSLKDRDIQLSVLTVLLAIHHEAHLTHGDCNDDSWRHILLRECAEGRDFRIIDFDHATSHNCGQRMAIQIDDYEPPPKDFGCMELYDVVQWLNLWTPGIIEFLGYQYSIFQVGSVERLVACAMARQNSSHYGEETIRREAAELLTNYFDYYGYRFPFIGHPLEFKRKLNLPGVEEPEDEEIPAREKDEWEEIDHIAGLTD